MKGRLVLGVLCDKRMLIRFKEKFYRIAIRLAMTYGAKCWPIKKQYIHKRDITKMRILRWMCGKARNDRIRNERFQEHFEATTIR